MVGGFRVHLWAWVSLVGLTACGGSPSAGEPDAASSGAAVSQALVVAAAPSISALSPAKAVQGTTVTISGSGFVNGASVSFNGAAASLVTFVGSTRLKAVVPTGATSGPIRVTVPAGSADSAAPFVVLPKLTSVGPLHAFVGDFVTLGGSGFTATTGVKLGTLSAAFSVLSDSSISAAVPGGFVSGKVTVVTPGGNAVSTTNVVSLPLLSSFSPTAGVVGASVDITGEGFANASAVKLGTKAASFSIVSDTQIRAIVPVGAVSGKLTVETPKGNRTSSGTFTVIKLPVVSSFTPAKSELPITLTVNGQNFISVSSVKVGAVGVPFHLVNTKQLTADVPLGTPSGKVSVVNPAGVGTSAATFVAVLCADADADSVCDRDDRCPGFDDRIDTDRDGLADGCDVCPSASTAGQSCGAGLICDGAGACNELECNASSSGPGVLQGNLVVDATDTASDLAQLAGKWCVTGDLTINRTGLANLDGLSGVVEVGGNLGIGASVPGCSYPCAYGNGALTSLHGLEHLRRVGGTLTLQEQPGDAGLTDLLGLSGLKHLGSLRIDSALVLQDLHGLEGLTSIGDLSVQSADRLSSLSGLENLTSASNVGIYSTGVTSLHGLEHLASVQWLSLGNDASLTSLEPLSGLTSALAVDLSGLNISSLSGLQNLRDLRVLSLSEMGLTSLDGLGTLADGARVRIVTCPALTSLAGLGTGTVSALSVEANDSLLDCGNVVPTADADIEISNSFFLQSLSCLRNATELGSLMVNNPGVTNFEELASLTRVQRDLTLWGGHATTLAALSNLTSVYQLYLGNLDVQDLHGLENLSSAYVVYLRENHSLRSLHELTALHGNLGDPLPDAVNYLGLEQNWNLSQCEIEWLVARLNNPTVSSNVGNGEACTP